MCGADIKTVESDCNDWDLRVMDGASVREGRVEICFNNAWGTICNENYGVTDARILCSQLNFESKQYLLLSRNRIFHYYF